MEDDSALMWWAQQGQEEEYEADRIGLCEGKTGIFASAEDEHKPAFPQQVRGPWGVFGGSE